jgi:hypothetical protein
MALSLSRLIRNLANVKHGHTNQNKFLKTKAKIKEMKDNVQEASKDAIAIHDYISRADVVSGGGGGTPILEPSSLKFAVDDLMIILETTTPGTTVRNELVNKLKLNLEIGIVTTSAGIRYLTTRGRALQLGRTFRVFNTQMLKLLSNPVGKLK